MIADDVSLKIRSAFHVTPDDAFPVIPSDGDALHNVYMARIDFFVRCIALCVACILIDRSL